MALSLWTFSRWTTIAHHTCHGGYNNADPTRFFNSKGFALGSLRQRVTQWFDWMLPEAWNVEHNNLHHYRLGELDDPDLVERNLEIIREVGAQGKGGSEKVQGQDGPGRWRGPWCLAS